MKKIKGLMQSDTKHAVDHDNKLLEPGELRLDRAHKDWYNRRELGKQRGKPKYAPPREMKSVKTWKRK